MLYCYSKLKFILKHKNNVNMTFFMRLMDLRKISDKKF